MYDLSPVFLLLANANQVDEDQPWKKETELVIGKNFVKKLTFLLRQLMNVTLCMSILYAHVFSKTSLNLSHILTTKNNNNKEMIKELQG